MKTKLQLSPTTIGILGGAASAILYTVTNICLRQVSDVEPTWVSTIKAIPTIFVVLPMVILQSRSARGNGERMGSSPVSQATADRSSIEHAGTRTAFPRSELGWLVATSIVVQIFGNVGFQWALSILGLTISVPIVLATMLIGGAITGRLVLNEPVTSRRWIAVFVLIIATIVLSAGAGAQAEQPIEAAGSSVSASEIVADSTMENVSSAGAGQGGSHSVLMIILGLAANIGSGIVYALQGTMMRRSMQRGMSASGTLLVISVSGLAFLTSWSAIQFGGTVFELATASQFRVMVMAGIFNALAFFAMAKSLQHVSVLYVQLLNASQAGISAAAGWLIFSEVMNTPIVAGLVLTGIGLMFAGVRDGPPKRQGQDDS
ncbi:MAG: hypothetical protein AAGG44_11430 [Planctomycetota bacterium]